MLVTKASVEAEGFNCMQVNDNDIAQSAIGTDRYWSIVNVKCLYHFVYYSLV